MDAYNIELRSHDIATLANGKWLNDEIINMYANMITNRNTSEPGRYPRVHMFNTFFYSHLRDNGDKGYDKVKRWTKKFDLFACKYVLVPVHLGMHWCCAVINFDKKRIEYYDSLLSSNAQCISLLRNYLDKEHRDKKNTPFDLKGWTNYTPTVRCT